MIIQLATIFMIETRFVAVDDTNMYDFPEMPGIG